MKKHLFTFTLIIAAATANAQVTRDSLGNYHETAHDSTTTFTFTDLVGNVTPVFQTENGKAYTARTSKSGKYYRRYLRTEAEGTEQKSTK